MPDHVAQSYPRPRGRLSACPHKPPTQAARTTCMQGPCKLALVAPPLDRLGRSLYDLISMVAELRKRDIGATSLHEDPRRGPTRPRASRNHRATTGTARRATGQPVPD